MIGWLMLLALPCAADDLFLTPSSFTPSPGERIILAIEGSGGTTSGIKDPVLIAATGIYNLTNLRVLEGLVLVDGTAKSKGSLIAAVQRVHEKQHDFAKALLICDAPGDTARKVVGHALEIVPESQPSGNGFLVLALLHGKPAAELPVEIISNGTTRKRVGVTGADGKMSVKFGELGVYRIVVAHETMRASFTFEMK